MDVDSEIETKSYSRTSHKQLKYYADFVRHHAEMNTRHSLKSDIHAKLWSELACGLNKLEGATRTPEEWKNGMRNWLKQLRHRVRKNIGNIGKITPFEREVLEIFGESADSIKVKPLINMVTVPSNQIKRANRNRRNNKENNSAVKFEFVDSIDEVNSLNSFSNNSIESVDIKLFPNVLEVEMNETNELKQTEEAAQTPKKSNKYSTDEIMEMLVENLKERRDQEEKIVSVLNVVGNHLLAAAEAINELSKNLSKK